MTVYPPMHPEPPAAVRRLVGICARPALDATSDERLIDALGEPMDGEAVLSFGAHEGMLSLLARHLGSRELTGLPLASLVAVRLRARSVARAQQAVLEQIAGALAGAGIRMMPLKGAALARTVYAEPGDRPMGDLDLLVAPEDVQRSHALLTSGGFATVPGPGGRQHLDALALVHKGVTVRVELHHRALWNDLTQQLPQLWARGVELDGLSGARAAEPLVLLWQVFHHAFRSQIYWVPFRLIWVADVVGLVNTYGAGLDWSRARAEFGTMTRTLPLLDAITPLPRPLLDACGVAPRLARAGSTYRGWPRQRLRSADGLDLGVASETIWPSAWWLALRYGLGTSLPRRALARVIHAGTLASHAW